MAMKVVNTVTDEVIVECDNGHTVVFELPSGCIEVSVSGEWPDCIRVFASRSLQNSIRVRPVAGNVIEVEPFKK